LRDSASRFVSSNLGQSCLAGIVEKELIAVEIIDHQKPVARKFRMQRIQRGNPYLRFGVQGNEDLRLTGLLRGEIVGQDEGAALPVDLCDSRSAVLVVAPEARESKPTLLSLGA